MIDGVGHNVFGEVEIDGAYFGGHIRPANLREDRVDRRRARDQTGTRRVVVAIRARKGRTLTFVTNTKLTALIWLPATSCRVRSSLQTRPAGITCREVLPWAASITRKPTAT